MANANFAQVVHAFLRDRLVEKHIRACRLDSLLDNPDLSNEYENHLRASALVGAKRDAVRWLCMHLEPVSAAGVPEALWFRSHYDWQLVRLDAARLAASNTVNAFGQPIMPSAVEFAAGQLAEGSTNRMLSGVTPDAIARACLLPGDSIWVPSGANLMCVEGNARMHALALGFVRGVVQPHDIGQWKMWVGRP